MRVQPAGSTTAGRPALAALGRPDRWVLLPVVVGLVFGAIQTVHIFQMLYYGMLGVLLESVVPWLLAAVVVAIGPGLVLRGYNYAERRRVVGWMGLFAALVGLLFGWALSHQYIVGLPFVHDSFVMTTNLIAGSLLGSVVGLYDLRSRRRHRALEGERETVSQQRLRLSVLNRVLRHNLRNDLNQVSGYAELLEDRPDDPERYLAEIRTLAADLVSIGEKAREIEDVVASGGEPRTARLNAVVEGAVDAVRADFGGCEIRVTPAADDPAVDASVLAPVVRELVENACRHADREDATVDVEADVDRSRTEPVRLTVADDGPGIPEHELAPLREGTETALQHGSGLGLWLVEWGTTSLGGRIEFGPNDPEGTVATLRVPTLD